MLDVLVFAAFIAQGAAPSPSPQASPLKEITHVTARTLCTALHDHIGPSIMALMQNDAAIEDGEKVLEDRTRLSNGRWMGSLHLENDVAAITRNLDKMDELLRDAPDAATADGADHAAIERLKSQLGAAEAAQRAELNVLDGASEAQQFARAFNDDPAGFDLTFTGWRPPPSEVTPSGQLPSRPIARAALQGVSVILDREHEFTKTLLPLAAQCRGSATAPP
jgi:hypothetical protein